MSSSIPYDWPLVHTDAFYFHDFGETYADEAAWNAAKVMADVPASPPPPGLADIYKYEEAGTGTFDTENKFNCRASRRVTDSADFGNLSADLYDAESGSISLERTWHRATYWIPGTLNPDTGYWLDYGPDGNQFQYNLLSGDAMDQRFEFLGSYDEQGYVSFDSIKDRWITIISLLDAGDGPDGRARFWVNGKLVTDTWRNVGGITSIGYQSAFYSYFQGDSETPISQGFFEFVYGGTHADPINPYTGLQGLGNNVIAYNNVEMHPDAFYGHDFGSTYADTAAWKASFRSFASTPEGYTINETAADEVVLDAARPFNGRSSMRIPSVSWADRATLDQTEILITTDTAPPSVRSWGRTFLWLDAAMPVSNRSFATSLCDMMSIDNALTNYTAERNYGGITGTITESWRLDGPDPSGGVAIYTEDGIAILRGRWVPIVVLMESDGVNDERVTWWRDGEIIGEATRPVDMGYTLLTAGISTWFIDPSFICDESVAIGDFNMWFGLIEWVDGGTVENPINPYCGLEGFPSCDLPLIYPTCPQYGGVTGFTHEFTRGTIRTTVDLGGVPRGGYRKHVAIGLKGVLKLPITPVSDPVVEGALVSRSLVEDVTIDASGYTETSIEIPAAAILLSVSVRVTTEIPGPTTDFDVGISGTPDKFSTASVSVVLNSYDVGTKAGTYYNATSIPVRLTMNGGSPATNAGRVRVTINYLG